MSDFLRSYLTVAIFGGVSVLLIGGLLGVAALLRPSRPTREKLTNYESGVDPVGNAYGQSQIRYYIFALLFVMFDVEAVFIFPWAVRLEVDVLARTETIALLRARIPGLDDELADALAVELGDLPLAAAQAAAYLEQTALPAADYLRRFRAHRADLLDRGEVVGYAGRLDTTWGLSLERLRDEDPAAVQLLQLAAHLAPEPIPLTLFGDHPELLDEPLRSAAADPDALADTVGALVGYSLARRSPDGFQVHRLVDRKSVV